ncbi:hypothetical protein C7441_11043 [Pseudaminobacter salicylatoxidans]|uniref:Uncharacterized protein n=1 Tax=Pseudaminobacter salicylatoxidans TaxID=93369 RepID=A0A316C0K6_PSESE|nr:hypothetical protein [Pseudaminobacter salicylatoxidans]PWJ81511.1 hypothetical protein C7441_11043 [Pseudaminobacter salicylatoxidans]
MDARAFHNAIRILLNLGQHDLAAAGVIDGNWGTADASDRDQVEAFIDNPVRETLRMPDANYERLFALIESRQKAPEPTKDLVAALIAAKQEMWLAARHQWTMADFKNWAVIQQIDAALEKADGKPRTAEAIAKAEATS